VLQLVPELGRGSRLGIYIYIHTYTYILAGRKCAIVLLRFWITRGGGKSREERSWPISVEKDFPFSDLDILRWNSKENVRGLSKGVGGKFQTGFENDFLLRT
jgi:hypothetical protein